MKIKKKIKYYLSYLSFVTLPQGVKGVLIDFVLPPCGWSTAFIATPRTIGFLPKERQKPAFPFRLFLWKEILNGSIKAKE